MRPLLLCIEDHAETRELLAEALSDRGFQVVTAADGAGGLRHGDRGDEHQRGKRADQRPRAGIGQVVGLLQPRRSVRRGAVRIAAHTGFHVNPPGDTARSRLPHHRQNGRGFKGGASIP